ncbi:MAG TPA: hypothetical protein VGV39_15300 [Mesorhizobium sp.]|uniref:helix-turn-helix transcriptional regulator n=1 Tax=Mesorhizobium sp. TaxID=1871066 RepID=UPI002DDCD3BD|nr:hypothetical protein [Mesorhizobium sp.]HEV2504444.1 hypothetical protein [Mesorhizobium sp.]
MKHDTSLVAMTVPRITLSLAKVAIALDLSPNMVLQLVREHRLPKPKTCGRRKLWRVSEIEAYVAGWDEEDAEDSGEDVGGTDSRWEAD